MINKTTITLNNQIYKQVKDFSDKLMIPFATACSVLIKIGIDKKDK